MPKPERPSTKHETVMDITEERIARVYAQAFMGAVTKTPNATDLVEELTSLVGVLDSQPRLEELFRSQLIAPEHTELMLDRIFGQRASAAVLNFLKVLSAHGRLGLVRPIAQIAKKLDSERRGLTDVEVRVARELDEDIRNEIETRIHRALNTQPVLNISVDPSLIAGIWVRVGDRVFDGSLATQLEHARRAMIDRATEIIETNPHRFFSD